MRNLQIINLIRNDRIETAEKKKRKKKTVGNLGKPIFARRVFAMT